MAVVARYLIDTSAEARAGHPEVARRLSPLITAGLVATCAPLDFEALYSARSPAEYDEVRADRALAYENVPTHDADWGTALEIQRRLAQQGQHRSVGMADLLVAAIAERERLTVLHYDRDFDVIGAITGQHTDWVVPAGSV